MARAQEDPALHEGVENSEIANPNYGVPPCTTQNATFATADGTRSYRDRLQGVTHHETFSFNANPLFTYGRDGMDCD